MRFSGRPSIRTSFIRTVKAGASRDGGQGDYPPPRWSTRNVGSNVRNVEQWLTEITEIAIVVIDAMALFVILVGTVVAFVAALRAMFSRSMGVERRIIWLRYARWLVAGLTFQLAADIIESAIATSWDAVGRLAAIAVIRTFLNYFLERDVEEIRKREQEQAGAATTESA